MSYLIRAVDPERDAQRLVDIYNPYIEKTTITYEYDSLTREQFLERINSVIKDYPYIVIEDDGEIIGYAYASCFNERSAYSWDADLAIYLDMNCRGKGAGSLLFAKLLEILEKCGFINAYSLIDIPNRGSEALHKKFGFAKTGSYVHSAYKFDKWLDMGIYSKCISDADKPGKIDRDWKKYL